MENFLKKVILYVVLDIYDSVICNVLNNEANKIKKAAAL